MNQPPQPTPGWYPDPSTGEQRWWDGNSWATEATPPPGTVPGYPPVVTLAPKKKSAGLVPMRGKFAAVAVPGLVLLTLAWIAGCGGSAQDDRFGQQLEQKWGISIDQGAAVQMAKAACKAPIAGTGLYKAQQDMQQRYPKYNLNTVARVMAAGVLEYCPERLP